MNLAVALEISVLFVCIWGFIAILLTGQFGFTMVLLCTAAVIAGYYVRRKGWRPSALIGNLSAIIVFLITIFIFATTYNLLSATLHLFLFLQVTKYITRRELSESRWCYVISLFNVIGASVITTAVVFGPVLIIHLFLMLVSLRLYVTAQEIERARKLQTTTDSNPRNLLGWRRKPSSNAAPSPIALQHIRRPSRLLFSGILLTIVTLGMAAGIFSIIPRLSTNTMFQNYGPAQEDSSVSAFSETVEFGSFTEIQLDERVALFVQPIGTNRPDHVRMRGVALEHFDGRSWRRTGVSYTRTGSYDFQPGFTTRLYPKNYTFRVMQPPGISNFLFADTFPTEIKLSRNFPVEVDPLAQSVALLEPPMKDFQYEVASIHEDLLMRQDPETIVPVRPRAILLPRSRYRPTQEPESTEEALPSAAPDPATGILDFLHGAVLAAQESDELSNASLEDEAITSSTDHSISPFTPPADSSRPRNGRRHPNTAPPYHGDDHTLRDTHRYWQQRRMGRMTGEQILSYYLQRCLELPSDLRDGRVGDLARTWTQNHETTFTKAMAIEAQLRTGFGYSLRPRARGNYIESFLFDVREGHCEYFATSMAVLLRNIGIPARVVNGFYSNEWNALSGNFTVRQKDAHSWVEAWMGDDYGWMTFDPTPPNGVGRRTERAAILEMFSRVSDALRMRWYRYVIDYSFSDQMDMMRSLLKARQSLLGFLSRSNIRGVTSDEARTIEQNGLSIDWRPLAFAGGIIFFLIAWQTTRWMGRRRRSRLSPVKFYDTLLKLLLNRGITLAPGETPHEFAQRVTRIKPEWEALVPLTHYYYLTRYHDNGSPSAQNATGTKAKPTRQYASETSLPDDLAAKYYQLKRDIKKRDKTSPSKTK